MDFSVENGVWRVTGKTFQYKDQLKALGGHWDGDEKAWILPIGADADAIAQMATESLKQLKPADQQAAVQRQALQELGHDSVHACNAHFSGKTYSIKDLLKQLGCRWNGREWVLEGSFNKRALCEALDEAKLEWHWYRPNCFGRWPNDLFVDVEYDAERHARLDLCDCKCTKTVTCDHCRFACCALAVPLSAQEMGARRAVGVIYNCTRHGCVSYAKDD